MTADARPTPPPQISARAGTAAVALGALFMASTVVVYLLSLTDVLDWPNWLRAVGLAGLPIGLVGTPLAYALARRGPGRRRAAVGLALMGAALLAFVALLATMG